VSERFKTSHEEQIKEVEAIFDALATSLRNRSAQMNLVCVMPFFDAVARTLASGKGSELQGLQGKLATLHGVLKANRANNFETVLTKERHAPLCADWDVLSGRGGRVAFAAKHCNENNHWPTSCSKDSRRTSWLLQPMG